MMTGWEFGSVLQKIQADLPEATENESWQLEDGTSYDPNIFTRPSVSAKFFNKRVTFEVPMSFTEMQVKQSFSGPEQLNGFLSMLYSVVEKSLTVKIDSLIMRTINNMTAETIVDEFGANSVSGGSHVKARNLLYEWNQAHAGATLTAAEAIKSPDFLRFASVEIGLTAKRMTRLSSLFNVGGKDRFTPSDLMHIVLLADFSAGAEGYLYSPTYHDEFVRLPAADIVPYWQGSGTGYGFSDVSTINVKTATNGTAVNVGGILGVMFDRDALGVTNLDRRVTTNYNPKAEFYNNWFKFDSGYYNDLNENFVVFFVA